MDGYNVDTTIAVATAAVRKAKNSDVFIDEVEDKTGITIEVIRGEKEAEYDFLGVISTLDIEDCVIADTGGGSTELILVIGGDALARVSLPIGAVNMTERFMGYGETKDALEGLDDYIDSHLDKINWLGDAEGLPIVCMGGSMYNFAIMEQGLSGFESGLHGYTIPAREAANANEILLGYERVGTRVGRDRERTSRHNSLRRSPGDGTYEKDRFGRAGDMRVHAPRRDTCGDNREYVTLRVLENVISKTMRGWACRYLAVWRKGV